MHFHDFGISGRVHELQTIYSSLETPGYLKEFKEIPTSVSENIIFGNINNSETVFPRGKDGHRKIMKIPLKTS